MPEKILELLETGSLTEFQIAEKLNASVAEIKACMEYLEQISFIKSTFIIPTDGGCSGSACSSGCSGHCCNCGSTARASVNSGYTIWEIL